MKKVIQIQYRGCYYHSDVNDNTKTNHGYYDVDSFLTVNAITWYDSIRIVKL